MGMVKRQLELSYVRVPNLDGEGIQCTRCAKNEVGYLEVVDSADVRLVCRSCVEASGQLCPECMDGVMGSDSIPDANWQPIQVCDGCVEGYFAQ
jgi:hypothetical protein